MMKNQSNKQSQNSITKHAKRFLKVYNNTIRKALKREINAYLLNKKQNNINKALKKLKLGKLIDNSISERHLSIIRKLNAYPLITLQQIAKLRNINSNMSKANIVLALLRSEPIINEKKYSNVKNNEIHIKINDVRLQLFRVSSYINKKVLNNIRKRLYDIKNITKIDRPLKNRLLKELNSISTNLKFVEKLMISDYRDDNYENINDIKYIFGDIDDYYIPILTSSLFDGGYRRYRFRGDNNRNMSVESYFSKIIPYLRMLIDQNKVHQQKIQLDMGFNVKHMADDRRITHFSRSDNVIWLPFSATDKVTE